MKKKKKGYFWFQEQKIRDIFPGLWSFVTEQWDRRTVYKQRCWKGTVPIFPQWKNASEILKWDTKIKANLWASLNQASFVNENIYTVISQIYKQTIATHQ